MAAHHCHGITPRPPRFVTQVRFREAVRGDQGGCVSLRKGTAGRCRPPAGLPHTHSGPVTSGEPGFGVPSNLSDSARPTRRPSRTAARAQQKRIEDLAAEFQLRRSRAAHDVFTEKRSLLDALRAHGVPSTQRQTVSRMVSLGRAPNLTKCFTLKIGALINTH